MIVGIDASRVAREDKTGTENYSYNMIKALARVDKKTRYVLYFNQIPPFFEIGQPNFSTRVLRSPRLWTQLRLAREIFLKPPDILFVPAHTIPVIRRPGLKTIVTIHDLGAEYLAEYHQFPQKYYLNWSTNFVARNATKLVAVSQFTKKSLIDRYSLDPSRIEVVYEGVDRNHFYRRSKTEIDQVKQKYGLKRNYLLFVGSIQPRKNLRALIEAFSKSGLRNLDLVLAGGRGWLYEEIYKAPEQFGVSEKVKFPGFVDNEDLPALYSGASGFVFPSLYEGFGLPILEAFACKVPVLTSNTGATKEVAEKAAVLVDPRRVEKIAEGLAALVEKNNHENFVKAGLKRVETFSWEQSARQLVKIFEEVYKGPLNG